MQVFAWLGLICSYFCQAFLAQKRQLFSPGPAESVPPKAAREQERKLAVDESYRSGRRQFQEIRESLLRNVFWKQLFVPDTHFAKGAVDSRHEGENQNGLTCLGGFRVATATN